MTDPKWVTETKKEIVRLNQKIARLERKIDRGESTSYDYEDLDNWTGWRAALKWVLKLRKGKATRKDAWGDSKI